MFICDGTILKNFDASGKEVNGWKAPTLDAPLALPIRWWSFDGKDYLVTCSKAGTIKSFDRGGAARGKAFNFPRGSFNYNLLDGSNYENIEVAAADSLGNLIRCNLNGNCKSDHILTITDYSMLLTNANGDVRYVSIWDEHVVGINKDLDVRLDFQTSEKITSARWIRKEKGWLALAVESSGQLYISDSEGRMLKKMPVAGDRHNLVLDLDGNGVKELVTHSGKGELVAYSLSY